MPTNDMAGPAWRDHGEVHVVPDLDQDGRAVAATQVREPDVLVQQRLRERVHRRVDEVGRR